MFQCVTLRVHCGDARPTAQPVGNGTGPSHALHKPIWKPAYNHQHQYITETNRL